MYSTKKHLALVTIFLMVIQGIYSNHEITHPKGNSVTYDDRAAQQFNMLTFDFKRLPQQQQSSPKTLNLQASFSSSASSSSPLNNVRLFPIVSNNDGTTSSKPLFPYTISPKTHSSLMKPSSKISSSPPSFPKSINEKIKSILDTTDSSTDKFYQQVIPKLTTMILNSRPTILQNDEDTVVQYRSPNALILNSGPVKTSTPIRLRSSFASSTKRINTIDPSTIKFLTNLQQKKLSSMNTSSNRNYYQRAKVPQTTPSSTSSPRETYMTLSFEQTESDSKPEEPQVYPSNESRFYIHHRQSVSSGETQKKRRSRAPERQSSPTKVVRYYQQTFNSDPDSDKDEQINGNSEFKSTRLQELPRQNSPSMTLSFQDQRLNFRPTGTRTTKQTGPSPGVTESPSEQFDWQKSISRYAKEFGFEMPDYSNGDTTIPSNSGDEDEQTFSPSTSSISYSRQPSKVISKFLMDNDDYEGSGDGVPEMPEINLSDFSNFIPEDDLFSNNFAEDTDFEPNFLSDTNEPNESNNQPSNAKIQNLLTKFSTELKSIDV